MEGIFLRPEWFSGYDLALEMLFITVTLMVSIYALRTHNLTRRREPKILSIAFLLISISHLMRLFLNLLIISEIGENVSSISSEINEILLLNQLGIYTHIFLFMAGLLTLAYMSIKTEKPKLYSLILLIIILPFFFTTSKLLLFYVISSVLLAYILSYYLNNYLDNRSFNTLLIPIAFGFLLLSNIDYIFSVHQATYYAVGHILELASYLLILTNFISIRRK